MITAIVNTCALGGHGNVGSSGKPHAARAALIENEILPSLHRPEISEIIVVGEYREGDGYRYIHSPSVYKNCRDVLAQRQLGAEAATNDWLWFQMDDHVLSPDANLAGAIECGADVVSTYRRDRNGELLNSGFNDARGLRYIHTHGILLSRKAVGVCPWSKLTPIHAFDIVHTLWCEDAGFSVGFLDPGIIDVE